MTRKHTINLFGVALATPGGWQTRRAYPDRRRAKKIARKISRENPELHIRVIGLITKNAVLWDSKEFHGRIRARRRRATA